MAACANSTVAGGGEKLNNGRTCEFHETWISGEGRAMSAPQPSREYVAFDLETTGLMPEFDRVVEIGAVRFDAGGRELGRFERLVNPGRAMSASARAVHGISDRELVGAPPARAVLPQFLKFLGDA